MADFENLTLEHLRAIRSDIKEMRRTDAEIQRTLVELRSGIALLMQTDVRHEETLADHSIRLERLERRLDLRDGE